MFCWAYARAKGGKFILRIEDTDQKRSSDAASMAFFEDLKWLGIDWDEGPEVDYSVTRKHGGYVQSNRWFVYRRWIDKLLRTGKAYYSFETTKDLHQSRLRSHSGGQRERLYRQSLDLKQAEVLRKLREEPPPVVRFLVPEGIDVQFEDVVRGHVSVSSNEIEDFVIWKRDQHPTYHLAVVVDDKNKKITHVIRAEEHLSNTFKHVLLQDALGFKRPVYGHLSVICNSDGSKMSKRDVAKQIRALFKKFIGGKGDEETLAIYAELEKIDRTPTNLLPFSLRQHRRRFQPISELFEDIDFKKFIDGFVESDHQESALAYLIADYLGVPPLEIDVEDFRVSGYLPEVLINYLALLGWNPGDDIEKFDRDFLISRFDLDRVHKSPAKFDRDKLLSFSLDAIQALPPEKFVALYREHAQAYRPEFIEKLSEEQFNCLARANHPRAKTLDDTLPSSRFFIVGDDEIVYEQTKAVRKALSGGGEPCGYDHLEAIIPELRKLSEWTVESIEEAIKTYADAHTDGKLGKVAQPLRIAVSGGTISPAIFDTLCILGRKSVLKRIERCLAHRNASV